MSIILASIFGWMFIAAIGQNDYPTCAAMFAGVVLSMALLQIKMLRSDNDYLRERLKECSK